MENLNQLSDRELLILIAERQTVHKEDLDTLKLKVEGHEKLKNTLIGAMTTSLVASITAFFKSFN